MGKWRGVGGGGEYLRETIILNISEVINRGMATIRGNTVNVLFGSFHLTNMGFTCGS